MATFSILLPFAPHRPEQVLPYAALTQWSAAHRLWQGQALLNEPYQAFAYAAASGFRVPVGIGVALMPFRHPYEAALQAQFLAVTMGHPVVAGYGPGALVLQGSMLGAPYRSQLGAVREYVSAVRGLLSGEVVDQDGEYFTCHSNLFTMPRPPVEIGLGVLRPKMAELAGEVADVAITWLTSATYLRNTLLPALRAGAEAVGRPVPRVVAIVPLALTGPDREPAKVALASNAGHLRLPHYRDMLRRSGIDVDSADPVACAKAIVAGGAFLSGELKVIVEMLTEFGDAGVDEIVLNLTGVSGLFGSRVALSELEMILNEVAS